MRLPGKRPERRPVVPAVECWSVYVLRCGDGSLYTGITTDVNRRCRQHNAGTASRYTRGRLPVRLVYQEAQPSRGLALKREAAIKALPRRQKESLIRRRAREDGIMASLYRERHLTSRFTDDRIIPRFHLEAVKAGIGATRAGVGKTIPVASLRTQVRA